MRSNLAGFADSSYNAPMQESEYEKSDLVQGLNEPQKAAVLAVDGPILILAGAGSGKTRVITHRIAHLIRDRQVDPENVLAVTFTNKAAAEMKERVQHLLGGRGIGAWVTTFHSMGARVLRKHAEALGYDIQFSIYGPPEQKSLVKRVLQILNLDAKQYPPARMLEQISSWKQEILLPSDIDPRTIDSHIIDIFRVYQEEIKKAMAMELDDLLYNMVLLFRNQKSVLESYQKQFQYIMVDEYQDTNPTQYMLIRLLSEGHGNLCVVGDEDQSIYSWRGADISNILNFNRDFGEDRVRRFELNINYRCPRICLEAANHLIENNTQRFEGKGRLVAHKGGDDRIAYYQARDGHDEARYVLSEIRRLQSDGVSLGEMVILYRTHAQSRVLEQEFIRSGLPYRIFGGHRFFERKEIKDILAYLSLIQNPLDAESLYRILNVPPRGIGATAQEKLRIFSDNQNVAPLLALAGIDTVPDRSRKQMLAFYEFFEALCDGHRDGMSLLELTQKILDTTGYAGWLISKEEGERVENVQELLSTIAEYEAKEDEPSLGGFLEKAALVAAVDDLDRETGTVTLMTLHNAKGLEFPVVFIVGMEEGLFPHKGSMDDPTRLEEERRLCYVGITRAQQELFFSAARMRFLQGEELHQIPSRFLREIGEDYVCRV